MTAPEQDLVTKIATSLSLTKGTNIFYGPPRPPENGIDVKSVFVFPIGGPKAGNFLGSSTVRRESDVQIRVRGEQEDYDGSLVFARQVRDAANHASIAGYIEIEVLSSEPLPLGLDDQGYPEWSMTVRMIHND